ncbi:MAG TPA: aminoglycoside phosphotransferase family protein [Pseudonocardiaceae bacterium]|jgi:aminoglycoside phosphotransferase (APT) family kinase protein|nr:aminoglycoside phosphotransferase family protein [Pseudonocardiaceae bacterium]
MDLSAVAARLARLLGLGDVESVAGGLEFAVFRAATPTGEQRALRVPREPVYRTPGEVPVPAARLQEQERAIYQLLSEAGLPVPRPVRLIEDAESGLPVLVSQFVSSDGAALEAAEVGRFLAKLHGLPVGPLDLVTHENTTGLLGLAARLRRRWGPLREQVPDLPGLPVLDELLAEPRSGPSSLLHLDVRACNLLSVAGELRAVVDWSSAMVAHPALEFARMREYAQLDENGIDLAAITAEYQRHRPVPRVLRRTEAVFRLDAVSMLTLVFLGPAPNPDRAAWAVERVRELIDVVRSAER